jgi:hypothetical protein
MMSALRGERLIAGTEPGPGLLSYGRFFVFGLAEQGFSFRGRLDIASPAATAAAVGNLSLSLSPALSPRPYVQTRAR